MRFDAKTIKAFGGIKANQIEMAIESVGRIFGGGKKAGIAATLSAVSIPAVGVAIHEEKKKNELKEKNCLLQKGMLKQDVEIKVLKAKADKYQERELHNQAVIDALLNSRRGNDQDGQV